MADKRKLQGEIDRCHKKVTEGVDAFQETWKKLQQASNPNQKEKYEQDLKKEIKKLQRLRDQIKTWCASSEVKDKRTLLDDRKIIETQMETFKIVERETKTKAYSKEALGLPTKIDPVEKERQELREWLMNTIDNLNIEIDKFEADVESIHAQCKKGKNKDKSDKLEELQSYITKHRWHIHNLEALLRMLDNSTVDLEDVKTIQEEVDYYLKEYQEPDFFGNDYLYDDVVDPEILNSELSFNTRLTGQLSDEEDNDDNSMLDDNMSHVSHDSFHNESTENVPLSPSSKVPQIKSKTSPHQVPAPQPIPQPVPIATPTPIAVTAPAPVRSRHNTPNNNTQQPVKQPVPVAKPAPPPVPPSYSPTLPPSSVSNSLYNNHPMSNSSTDSSITSPTLPLSSVTNDLSMVMSNSLNPNTLDMATSLEDDPNQEAFTLDPILGVTPLGPIPLTQERLMQLEMLESASHHLPLPSDTSRLSLLKIIPSFPVPIPPHHQHNYEPSKHNFDTYEYFQKLQPDTLFFIFYYYEGTRAQYLAAKALKEQSWRFHKKHKLWFQRYEEPKKIAETYETGTYIYFDIKQWSQRKKEDFTFEYKYLEEIQLNE